MFSPYGQVTYRTVGFRAVRLVFFLALIGLAGIILIGALARIAANDTASPSEIAEEPLAIFSVVYGVNASFTLLVGASNRIRELMLIRRDSKIVFRR